MANDLTRRGALAAMGAGVTAAAWPWPALALDETRARRLVESLVDDINSVIASGKSEGAM